ncbi:MAG: hypothetical protein ACREQQ_04185, partial [Candidatus Binatia bacterium]
MDTSPRQLRRLVLITVLPWLISAASLLFAAVWVGSTPREDGLGKDGDPRGEHDLRLALAAAESESKALRRELDRLIAGGAGGARGSTASP